MIRILIAVALLALVLTPLVSLHHLRTVEAQASVRIPTAGAARMVRLDALIAATRL